MLSHCYHFPLSLELILEKFLICRVEAYGSGTFLLCAALVQSKPVSYAPVFIR
jgi:hypothetical protein